MKAKSTQTWDCPSDNKGAACFGGKKVCLIGKSAIFFVFFYMNSSSGNSQRQQTCFEDGKRNTHIPCKKEVNKSNENNHGGSVSLFSAKLINTLSRKKMNKVKRPQDWG